MNETYMFDVDDGSLCPVNVPELYLLLISQEGIYSVFAFKLMYKVNLLQLYPGYCHILCTDFFKKKTHKVK